MQNPSGPDTKLSRTFASTETLRLAEMHTLDIYYTPLEERFERLTRLARRTLQVPIAAISVLTERKEWFKSVAGWNIQELPLTHSLNVETIRQNAVRVIPDTKADATVADHPLVKNPPRLRFYAGCPLRDNTDTVIGTFSIYDLKPRRFSVEDAQCLLDYARLTESELSTASLTKAQAILSGKLGVARREALIDPLTRLWNRRGATMLLKGAMEEADRDSTLLSVAVLDLDRFKRINDSYGHNVGDDVLRRVARILVGCVRSDDMLCRFGGDEFLLIMADTNSKEATTIAERIQRRVYGAPIRTRDGRIPISVSIGYTVRDPEDEASIDALFHRADEALLHAKGKGGNKYRMASEEKLGAVANDSEK